MPNSSMYFVPWGMEMKVLTDCNFPSDSVAAETVTGKFIQIDGLDIPELAKTILSVFPLDSFVSEPVFRMEVVGKPD